MGLTFGFILRNREDYTKKVEGTKKETGKHYVEVPRSTGHPKNKIFFFQSTAERYRFRYNGKSDLQKDYEAVGEDVNYEDFGVFAILIDEDSTRAEPSPKEGPKIYEWAWIDRPCPVIYEVVIHSGASLAYHKSAGFLDECDGGCLAYVKEEIEEGADPKFRDSYGLQVAAANGFLDIVEYLVEQGCDVNKNLPAQQALFKGHTHVVKYLVSKGASIGTIQMGLLVDCDEDVLQYLQDNEQITDEQLEEATKIRNMLKQ